MTSSVCSISFDCHDTYRQAQFWSQVFGTPMHPEDFPGDPESIVEISASHDCPHLLFIQVPDDKAVKNRVHLDLQPDGPRDAEVERLLELGAEPVDDRRNPDGTGWMVLTDPEGNEFCVLRSAAERAATTPVH
jgi:predicted enzyme related to lactoylglutathione lyase